MAPSTKHRKIEQLTEITFDPAAREEYLTGFHKRKVQRVQNAREAAAKKEKEEKVRERRQLREQRKEDLEKHVAEVNAELRKQNPDISDTDDGTEVDNREKDWEGVAEAVPEVAEDEEYVDEDKFTTVTVEAMEAPGERRGDDDTAMGDGKKSGALREIVVEKKKRPWSKDSGTAAKKKKKFRYESKAERQMTRQKQKSKSSAAKSRRMGQVS